MINKPAYGDTATLCKKTYTFTEPCRLRIKDKEGKEILFGYGVGDKIDILSVSTILLVPTYKKLKEIPLADGRVVVEYLDQFGKNLMENATEVYEPEMISAYFSSGQSK